jgi:hypothetical protein
MMYGIVDLESEALRETRDVQWGPGTGKNANSDEGKSPKKKIVNSKLGA